MEIPWFIVGTDASKCHKIENRNQPKSLVIADKISLGRLESKKTCSFDNILVT